MESSFTVCPQCRKVWTEERNKISSDYGNIPEQEYLGLLDLSRGSYPDDLPTLKEEIETHIVDGTFTIEYTAKCKCCGFSYLYNNSETIYELLPNSNTPSAKHG